ncbi:MAG: hydrogenase maturation protease [Candidatus Marinimicrobia bacterium]|nr:hydrogenase maturation protease [Candidatus Neomarinimicrobiota bacterium]
MTTNRRISSMSIQYASESGIVILGLGNYLMQDEGVGVHLARIIEANYQFEPEISVIDGGTMGLDLMPYFEENERVLIIDAMDADKPPATVFTLQNDSILAQLKTKLSLHHLGLSDVLGTIKLLDMEPSEIFLLGIQPAEITTSIELSDTISNKLPAIIDIILEKLRAWDVRVKPVSESRMA